AKHRDEGRGEHELEEEPGGEENRRDAVHFGPDDERDRREAREERGDPELLLTVHAADASGRSPRPTRWRRRRSSLRRARGGGRRRARGRAPAPRAAGAGR